MIKITHTEDRVLEAEVEGRILHDDYVTMIPLLEQAIKEHGSLRCVIDIKSIKGYEPRAMFDDLKFDLTHIRKIERCAILCDKGWLVWVMKFSGLIMPFTKIKCFEPGQHDQARTWAAGDEGDGDTSSETEKA